MGYQSCCHYASSASNDGRDQPTCTHTKKPLGGTRGRDLPRGSWFSPSSETLLLLVVEVFVVLEDVFLVVVLVFENFDLGLLGLGLGRSSLLLSLALLECVESLLLASLELTPDHCLDDA